MAEILPQNLPEVTSGNVSATIVRQGNAIGQMNATQRRSLLNADLGAASSGLFEEFDDFYIRKGTTIQRLSRSALLGELATSSQGAKADTALQPDNNLSDLDDVPTARTALGLGTAATQNSSAFATAAQGGKADTALQPGVTSGSGVRHDGTIVPPTLSQIPIITGGGWIGASGKSFGDVIDAIEGSDDTAVLLASQVPEALVGWSWTEIGPDRLSGFDATGTGNDISVAHARTQIRTSDTAGSTAKKYIPNGGYGACANISNNIDFSLPFIFAFRVSSNVRSTNGQARFTLAKGTADAVGPITRIGVGWLVEGNNDYLIYWDGSSEKRVATGTITGNSYYHQYIIRHYGSGVLRLYKNGQFIAQVTDFDNTDSGTASTVPMLEVLNGADASNVQSSFVWAKLGFKIL